jgi:hypothetical protein
VNRKIENDDKSRITPEIMKAIEKLSIVPVMPVKDGNHPPAGGKEYMGNGSCMT